MWPTLIVISRKKTCQSSNYGIEKALTSTAIYTTIVEIKVIHKQNARFLNRFFTTSYLYMNLTWIFICGLESFIYHTASNSIQPQSTPTAWYYTAPLAQFLWSTNKRLWFVVTVNVFFCTPSYADISVVHLWLVFSWPSWAGIKAIAKIFIFKIFHIFTIFMIHVEHHW